MASTSTCTSHKLLQIHWAPVSLIKTLRNFLSHIYSTVLSLYQKESWAMQDILNWSTYPWVVEAVTLMTMIDAAGKISFSSLSTLVTCRLLPTSYKVKTDIGQILTAPDVIFPDLHCLQVIYWVEDKWLQFRETNWIMIPDELVDNVYNNNNIIPTIRHTNAYILKTVTATAAKYSNQSSPQQFRKA